MARPGFYVNGRRYGFDRRSQAVARAEFLASEYGRDVTVDTITTTGVYAVEHTAKYKPTARLSDDSLVMRSMPTPASA